MGKQGSRAAAAPNNTTKRRTARTRTYTSLCESQPRANCCCCCCDLQRRHHRIRHTIDTNPHTSTFAMPSRIARTLMLPITLTPDEERMIVDEAERILAETFAAHQAFVRANREVAKDEWKHLKSKENIAVYRSTRITSATDRQASLVCAMPAELTFVMSTGTIPGTVDDAAFGALAHTESLTQLRNALVNYEFDATKVLATIRHPTPQDPFSSLTLKWTAKNIGALARVRDCVFIEAVGVATDADGAPVMFYVMQSLDNISRIAGLRHLDVVRMNISVCALYRQRDESLLEHYARGYMDTGGAFAEQRTSLMFPDFLLSSVDVVECAYVKRLMWLLHMKQLSDCTSSSSSSSSDSRSAASQTSVPSDGSSSSSSSRSKTCANCTASLSTLGSLVRARIVCQACRREVCRKCSVEKNFPVELTGTDLKLKQLQFCLGCLLEAKQAPARDVAAALMDIMQ